MLEVVTADFFYVLQFPTQAEPYRYEVKNQLEKKDNRSQDFNDLYCQSFSYFRED